MTRVLLLLLLACLCVACGGTPPVGEAPDGPGPDPDEEPTGDVPADPVHDAIAYVTADGDRIRLVDPDGANDRALWAHGQDDPHGVHEVWSLSWSPDATALAFASTHENACSLYHADVFTLAADGSSLRRVTQAPSCAALADRPSGTVRVPVRNSGFESFSGFLYFQGAPGVQAVNLPPGGTGTVTFENVADFGAGEEGLQIGAVIVGGSRALLASTIVDVVAGGSVTTAETEVYVPATPWETRSPTWSPDGERIGHVMNFNALWQLPPRPTPLDFGTGLLADTADPPSFVNHLAWGPTPATASQLLYAGNDPFEATAIYLVEEGSADAGTPLVTFDATETVHGLAWLPDGSGFVFSVTEGEYFGDGRSANLFAYTFGADATERVTDHVGDFAGQLAVSPDGERIVYELAADQEEGTGGLVDVDLWIVGRDGSDPVPFVEDAYAPAWSR